MNQIVVKVNLICRLFKVLSEDIIENLFSINQYVNMNGI